MAKPGRGQSKLNSPEPAGDEGAASFAWEFDQDEAGAPAPLPEDSGAPPGKARAREIGTGVKHTTNGTPRPVTSGNRAPIAGDRAAFGPARANVVHAQLDRALEQWWGAGELPSLALLREALFALEAGAPISESQRTLILRAALAYDRGVQTALRHQPDAERVALVLAEATVEWGVPPQDERIDEIVAADETIRSLFVAELARLRVLLTGDARGRAEGALARLNQRSPSPMVDGPYATSTMPVPPRRKPNRQILLLLLLITLLGFVLWQQRQDRPVSMVAMPEASYALLAANGSHATGVQLAAFWIDQFEVTNREYRGCVEQGGCIWPVSPHSMTRPDYFTNPAFDKYPVVNVTYEMAVSYCVWQGKRLPSAEEWQAAASVSLTNGQAFRFPWGETFEGQRTNSTATGVGDTVAVGSYRPSGDSPSGTSDMAGNVAEWTATDTEVALVKGGSFADGADALSSGWGEEWPVSLSKPTIGFRCARSRLLASP